MPGYREDADDRRRRFFRATCGNDPDARLPNIHRVVPAFELNEARRHGEMPARIGRMVTIYRCVAPDDPATKIHPGDWVSLVRRYAVRHCRSDHGRVLSKRVPAAHACWASTDMNEWFYAPRGEGSR